LEKGDIGGAALDVFEEEPYNGPLAKLENVYLSIAFVQNLNESNDELWSSELVEKRKKRLTK
jgi:phosphoglycerate dehydrogenase-like enzyme